jgi:hypothetical protein
MTNSGDEREINTLLPIVNVTFIDASSLAALNGTIAQYGGVIQGGATTSEQ